MDAPHTLLNNPFYGIDESNIVGTGGDAVLAGDAAVRINHHDTIRPFVGSAGGTVLETNSVFTIIAKTGEKKSSNIGESAFFNDLEPNTVDSEGKGHFAFTSNRASMATNTASQVNDHGKSLIRQALPPIWKKLV